MPRRPRSDPDSLLGRVLRLAEKDIRAIERRVRAAKRAKSEIIVDTDDRKAYVAVGEWLRKVSADSPPPDLSKLTDKELARLTERLKGPTT